jgi:hypothetical protein
LLGRLVIGGDGMAVRAARAARLGAGAEGFVDDGLDGAGATAAFGAATKAAIDLLWMTRQVPGRAHGIADILIAKDVARTDNHETSRTFDDARPSIFKVATKCKRKSCSFKQFQTDAERILE